MIGDEANHGITGPLVWLIGNATNEHVLFLEKDFQLVESLDCVMEQLTSGVAMIDVRGECCVSRSLSSRCLRVCNATSRMSSLPSSELAVACALVQQCYSAAVVISAWVLAHA